MIWYIYQKMPYLDLSNYMLIVEKSKTLKYISLLQNRQTYYLVPSQMQKLYAPKLMEAHIGKLT